MENAIDRRRLLRANLFACGILALPPLCNAGAPHARLDARPFADGVPRPHRISLRDRMARAGAMPLLWQTPRSHTRKMRTLRRWFRSATEGRHRDLRIRVRLTFKSRVAVHVMALFTLGRTALRKSLTFVNPAVLTNAK